MMSSITSSVLHIPHYVGPHSPMEASDCTAPQTSAEHPAFSPGPEHSPLSEQQNVGQVHYENRQISLGSNHFYVSLSSSPFWA